MGPRSRYIRANGINHHYLQWGDPEGPPLLMLHATGLCAHSWRPIAQDLGRDFRVVAFDQRGHGDTDPSDRGYTFQLLGEDLAAAIQALDLQHAYVVGQGWLPAITCHSPFRMIVAHCPMAL